ncbi:MAG: class I SAM-dependent methyltransferase [Candidatus Methanoperedens sp.]
MCPAEDYSHMDLENLRKVDYTTLLVSLAKYKFVKSVLSGKESLLDIGCGTGYGTFYLSEFCRDITGIDIDPAQIEKANKIYKSRNILFEHLDILKNPEVIKNKDIITCFEVIQDMSREKAYDFLKTINDNKDQDAVLFLSTPRRLTENLLTPNRLKYHLHEYTYDELHEDLNKIFNRVLILGQLDEIIGSLHKNNVWTFYCICF